MSIQFETCNGTSWSALKIRLGETSSHIIFGQEHKLVGEEVQRASQWASACGWGSAWAPAVVTPKGGISGGVVIFWKKFLDGLAVRESEDPRDVWVGTEMFRHSILEQEWEKRMMALFPRPPTVTVTLPSR